MCPYPVLIALTAYYGVGTPKAVHVNACAIASLTSFNEQGRRPGTVITLTAATPVSVAESIDDVVRKIEERGASERAATSDGSDAAARLRLRTPAP